MAIDYRRAHFEAPTDPTEKRRLFASSVSTILLELTEHCNRRCSYCPVSIVERNKNRTLPNEALEQVISDLETIDYDQSFCLNLYNEPTADKETLLGAVAKLRSRLPKSQIYFSTNGDYLTQAYIDELFGAGLSQLTITLHTPPTENYNDVDAISRFTAFAARIGSRVDIERFSPGVYIHGKLKYRSYDVTVFTQDFTKIGVNRGGSMDNVEVPQPRSAPCHRPFETVTISFDGRLFPCCQFYPDLPENDKYAIGTISGFDSIFDAYCSQAMTDWRRSLFTYGAKKSPCDTCLEANHSATPEEMQARQDLAISLGVVSADESPVFVAPPAPVPPVEELSSVPARPWNFFRKHGV